MPRNRVVAIPFLSVKEMLDISIIFCIKNLFSLPVSDIMTNLAVSTITKTLTKQIIIKLMKITQFRKNEDTIALSVMDLDILVNKIKTEIKSRPVSTFREHLRYTLSDERCMFADKLPKIIPAAEFRKVNGQKQMKNYNGIVELTIGPLSNKSEIALVKQKACEQPQTRCVFMGSRTIPRPRLSTGCEMLSAPNPVRYTSQRTDFGTIFAIIPRPGHHISSEFSPILSLSTIINARRNHFP